MALFDSQNVSDKSRFSLLLLDPGEIYLEDMVVYLYPEKTTAIQADLRKQKGWLKICSTSVVFEPVDYFEPILRFPFVDVEEINRFNDRNLSQHLGAEGKMIYIKTTNTIMMHARNEIRPYEFDKRCKSHIFSLAYLTDVECLAKIGQLHRAASLPQSEHHEMIETVVKARQSLVKFDSTWLSGLSERTVLELTADHVKPLVINPGRVLLTNKRLYFQPFNNVEANVVLRIQLNKIQQVHRRRFCLKQIGLEIECASNKDCTQLYLSFADSFQRDQLYAQMLQQPELSLNLRNSEDVTEKWRQRKISNYDYLLFLNSEADRSFNDLTQYPVFPWVIADYISPKLNLHDPRTFRDLRKPIGALNPKRLKELKERYEQMPEPKFLYGSHYSSPGYVLFYLSRAAPEYQLCLQNGKFDVPDRMFNSVADTWNNCLLAASDFKELIPEFYSEDATFLRNSQKINFGVTREGRHVGDVSLPPWASDADDMIRQFRAALESDHVSTHLHHWIDLVFGYKQRGSASIQADNVFYHLTYEGAVDMSLMESGAQRDALQAQIMEFGQTPRQLFADPHPARCASYQISEPEAPTESEEVAEDVHVQNGSLEAYNPWNGVNSLKCETSYSIHKGKVSGVSVSGDSIYSVGADGTFKIYNMVDKCQTRSQHLSSLPLTSLCVLEAGSIVIASGGDNNIYFYNVDFGRVLDTLPGHDDAVRSLRCRKNLLVSASDDATVKLWNYKTGLKRHKSAEIICDFELESAAVCVDLSANGARVVAGTSSGCVYVWDAVSHELLEQQQAHIDEISAVCISDSSEDCVILGAGGFIRAWKLTTGQELFSAHTAENQCCATWLGATVLTGDDSGKLSLWHLDSGTCTRIDTPHTSYVTCLSHTQSHVVSACADRSVSVWSSA